jgi:NSS family neurotransmitter:Na+ symporter
MTRGDWRTPKVPSRPALSQAAWRKIHDKREARLAMAQTENQTGSQSQNAGFSGSMAFILAASGSAVGLGNIWKFPYVTGENGGGAFVLFYLMCILALGAPLMFAEIFIGKRGKAGPVDSFKNLGTKAAARAHPVGYIFILTAFVALSVYGVIGGWAVYYTSLALDNGFAGMTPEAASGTFGTLMDDFATMVLFQVLFMAAITYVVAKGVSAGIERYTTILMPLFFMMLLGLTAYALTTSGAGMRSVSFMFNPDFTKLTPSAMAEALGHAFFSLSLGVGGMLVYGQYMPSSPSATPITRSVATIVVVDTLVALCAGLLIFSVIFGHGGEAAGGPGLLFMSLPVAFGEMTGGYYVAVLWFALVVVAALTSGISYLEIIVAHADRLGMGRAKTAVSLGVAITFVGFATVWSLGPGKDVIIFAGKNLFDTLDFFAFGVSLPLGGLVIAITVGWAVRREEYRAYLSELSEGTFNKVVFLTKYVTPVLIIMIMAYLIKTS